MHSVRPCVLELCLLDTPLRSRESQRPVALTMLQQSHEAAGVVSCASRLSVLRACAGHQATEHAWAVGTEAQAQVHNHVHSVVSLLFQATSLTQASQLGSSQSN